MRTLRALGMLLAVVLMSCEGARAGLSLSIVDSSNGSSSLTLAPGQSKTIELRIAGDSLIGDFNYLVYIQGSGSGFVTFTNVLDTSFTSDTNYVFSGNSGGVSLNYSPLVPPGVVVNAAVIGGDYAADFTPVSVSGTNTFLARLTVTADMNVADGNSFQVLAYTDLNPSNQPYTSYGNDDASGNGFDPIGSLTIRITDAPAAVPEPSTLAALASGSIGLLLVARRRTRRAG